MLFHQHQTRGKGFDYLLILATFAHQGEGIQNL